MTEQLQKCGNTLCDHKERCARFTAEEKGIFVPVGKAQKGWPAQRICAKYLPKE